MRTEPSNQTRRSWFQLRMRTVLLLFLFVAIGMHALRDRIMVIVDKYHPDPEYARVLEKVDATIGVDADGNMVSPRLTPQEWQILVHGPYGTK